MPKHGNSLALIGLSAPPEAALAQLSFSSQHLHS